MKNLIYIIAILFLASCSSSKLSKGMIGKNVRIVIHPSEDGRPLTGQVFIVETTLLRYDEKEIVISHRFPMMGLDGVPIKTSTIPIEWIKEIKIEKDIFDTIKDNKVIHTNSASTLAETE